MSKPTKETRYRLQPNSSGKTPAYDVELRKVWGGRFGGPETIHRITVYDFWQVKELAKDWENGAFDWKEVLI